MNVSGLIARRACEKMPSAQIILFDKIVSMAIMDTFFDFLSASGGAILGALFAFVLNHKRNKKMSNQLVVSRQTIDKIKLENSNLLEQIKEKENMILKLEMQILGNNQETADKKSTKKK